MSVSVLAGRNTSSNYLAAAEAVEESAPAPEPIASCSAREEDVVEQKSTEKEQKKRCYSSSESEKCQSSAGAKRRQHHRHNHNSRSKRKRLLFPENNCSNPVEGNVGKSLPRVPLTQQPKAPNNTTQFLITDREERESSDRDTTAADTSADFSQLRPRCFSSTCHNPLETSSFLLNSSDSDEEEEDSEFNLIYDNVSLERIQGLPREKVNREMLTTQKCNSQLVDKVTHLKTENQRLKGLLQEHGIDFKGNAANLHPFPLSSLSARRSNSSNEDGNPSSNVEKTMSPTKET